MTSAKDILADISGLPTLPSVVARINELVGSQNASASDINEVISSDMSLSSKLLKVVNSPFYGFPRRINSITHAVVILGFNTLRNLALSAFAFSAFKKRDNYFDHRAFWVHSLATATVASVIAERLELSQREKEDAFMAGLMHDIGKAVMCEFLSAEMKQAVALAKSKNILLLEAEYELGLCPHAELGGELLRKWNLPEGLTAQVENHHRPDEAGDYEKGAALIHTCDIIARALCLGWGGDDSIPMIKGESFEKLGLPVDDIGKVMDKTLADMQHMASFLDAIA